MSKYQCRSRISDKLAINWQNFDEVELLLKFADRKGRNPLSSGRILKDFKHKHDTDYRQACTMNKHISFK